MQLPIREIGFSIVAETPSYLVVAKPAGMPSVPLKQGGQDNTLLDTVSSLYPEVRNVQGRNAWEGGVVHRLDTPTCGITVVARTDEAWWNLQRQQDEGLFLKTYVAWSLGKTQGQDMFMDGFPHELAYEMTEGGLVLRSAFRPWGVGSRAVRPVCEDAGKYASRKSNGTLYETTIIHHSHGPGRLNTFRVRIARGFRHQIRCHMAWYGFPLVGDILYGGPEYERLGLFAEKVEFQDPVSNERVSYSLGSMFFS